VTISGEPPGSEHPALVNGVTPGWFAAYGTPLREGRDIDPRDTADAPPVVIVNEAFARRFLAGRSAVGERVAGRTVIGVAGDQVVQGAFKANGAPRTVRDEAPPSIYVPLAQSSALFPPDRTAVTLSVRAAAGAPARLARAAGAALTAVDPGVTFAARPLADYLDASLVQERTVAMLAGFFGGLALLLAALGLYGTTAYSVARRRPEIGIRLALGAAPAAVMRLVLTRVAWLVSAGVVIGAAASVWLSRFVASLLYGLGPRDPVTLGSAALILAFVGAIAGWLPASRAAHLAPADVLREG
jgi:putative ABC transport system permease protein